jgi:hypothetical protein
MDPKSQKASSADFKAMSDFSESNSFRSSSSDFLSDNHSYSDSSSSSSVLNDYNDDSTKIMLREFSRRCRLPNNLFKFDEEGVTVSFVNEIWVRVEIPIIEYLNLTFDEEKLAMDNNTDSDCYSNNNCPRKASTASSGCSLNMNKNLKELFKLKKGSRSPKYMKKKRMHSNESNQEDEETIKPSTSAEHLKHSLLKTSRKSSTKNNIQINGRDHSKESNQDSKRKYESNRKNKNLANSNNEKENAAKNEFDSESVNSTANGDGNGSKTKF